MTNFLYLIPVAFLMASCGGRNSDSASEAEQQSDTKMVSCEPIEGQWLIEQVVANDSDQLRPVDIDPEAKLYAHFYADSTFNFQTGCNAIGGRYLQRGDSVSLTDMMWTEMACEDMRMEQMLRDVLQHVNRVDWNNDSIVRLDTPTSAHVVLKKADARIKCNEPE